jgi:hypothetical protein
MSNSSTMYIDIDDQQNIKSIQKKKEKKKNLFQISKTSKQLVPSLTLKPVTPVETWAKYAGHILILAQRP